MLDPTAHVVVTPVAPAEARVTPVRVLDVLPVKLISYCFVPSLIIARPGWPEKVIAPDTEPVLLAESVTTEPDIETTTVPAVMLAALTKRPFIIPAGLPTVIVATPLLPVAVVVIVLGVTKADVSSTLIVVSDEPTDAVIFVVGAYVDDS